MGKWIRNWFSNFTPCKPFIAEGITYYTVENFFQAMKTTNIKERRIIAALSPSEAKRYCSKRNKHFKLRSNWEQIKIKVMEFGLRKKFIPGTDDYDKLLATGKEEIVEWNNWHDNIWGSCVCEKCNKGGANDLGRLLMKIRDEFVIKQQ
jgi:ribA/ribD-fused uncharacterized protein